MSWVLKETVSLRGAKLYEFAILVDYLPSTSFQENAGIKDLLKATSPRSNGCMTESVQGADYPKEKSYTTIVTEGPFLPITRGRI